MPLVDPSGLVIAAVPAREDVRDVLVSEVARDVTQLPQAARVGTGSLRRRCQLLAARPDLAIELVRGNIDTRLRKLREGQHAAIVLAAAGINRASLFDNAFMSLIEVDRMLPAPGQGALALQCRRDDHATRDRLAALNDPDTADCVDAERALVAALEGDCHSPIAALATVSADRMELRAAVGARDGSPPVLRAAADGPRGDRIALVGAVFASLEAQGVRDLLRPNS
jgi:hydroxymethylbilane synthase